VRTVFALSAVVLAVAAGGCAAGSDDSAEDFKGSERAVAAVIEGIEAAARKDDSGRVCEQLLSDSLLEALEKQGTNCKTAVKEGFDDADSLDLAVDDVKISGDTATARVTSGRAGSDQKTDAVSFVRDGAAWKVSSLSP